MTAHVTQLEIPDSCHRQLRRIVDVTGLRPYEVIGRALDAFEVSVGRDLAVLDFKKYAEWYTNRTHGAALGDWTPVVYVNKEPSANGDYQAYDLWNRVTAAIPAEFLTILKELSR